MGDPKLLVAKLPPSSSPAPALTATRILRTFHLSRFVFYLNYHVMHRLDAFVMGAGTGGCLAGVSLFLREKGSPAKVFLVDPPGSALYNRVRHGVCYSPQMSEREVRKHRYRCIHCSRLASCITQARAFENSQCEALHCQSALEYGVSVSESKRLGGT